MTITYSLGWGLAMGTTAMVSRRIGEKNEGEDIRVTVVPSQQAIELLANGTIRSAIPMVALFRFKDLYQDLKQQWDK